MFSSFTIVRLKKKNWITSDFPLRKEDEKSHKIKGPLFFEIWHPQIKINFDMCLINALCNKAHEKKKCIMR